MCSVNDSPPATVQRPPSLQMPRFWPALCTAKQSPQSKQNRQKCSFLEALCSTSPNCMACYNLGLLRGMVIDEFVAEVNTILVCSASKCGFRSLLHPPRAKGLYQRSNHACKSVSSLVIANPLCHMNGHFG